MPISKKLQLDDEQIEEILRAQWNCRIATIGPGSRINVTPMWFGWAGGRVYIYGRGQKVVSIRRQPECTIIVDRNEKYPELQAIMMQGQAHILESTDDCLRCLRQAMLYRRTRRRIRLSHWL